MKRKTSHSRRGRSNPNRQGFRKTGITTMTFTDSFTNSWAGTSTAFDLDFYPTTVVSNRWYSESIGFREYRIVRFEYTLSPSVASTASRFIHALLPVIAGTSTPSVFGDLATFPQCRIFDGRMVANQTTVAKRSMLLDQADDWWSVSPASTLAPFVQVHLMIIPSGAANDALTVEWRMVCEYRGTAYNNMSKLFFSYMPKIERKIAKALEEAKRSEATSK